jgi:hypothetical protein
VHARPQQLTARAIGDYNEPRRAQRRDAFEAERAWHETGKHAPAHPLPGRATRQAQLGLQSPHAVARRTRLRICLRKIRRGSTRPARQRHTGLSARRQTDREKKDRKGELTFVGQVSGAPI